MKKALWNPSTCLALFGAFLLLQGCTPNASSISKALIHANERGGGAGSGSGGGPVINLSDSFVPGQRQKLVVNYVGAGDYYDAIESMKPSELPLELFKDGEHFREFERLKSQGASELRLDGSAGTTPTKVWVLVHGAADGKPVQSLESKDCVLQIKPTSSEVWEISYGTEQSCKESRSKIDSVLVFFQRKEISKIQN